MSSKIELNSTYIKELKSLIQQKNKSKISIHLNQLHIADIAQIIEYLAEEDAKFFYSLMCEEVSAAVIIELEDNTRKKLLKDFSAKEIAEEVIENLETDDAADLIGEFSEAKKEEVLSHIENIDYANDISDLLTYQENTAGGLMAKELIKVNENWNTIQCLKEMRKQADNIKKVYTR